MSAPDNARRLLLMARKDFDAMRDMIGIPLFADEVFAIPRDSDRPPLFDMTAIRSRQMNRQSQTWRRDANDQHVLRNPDSNVFQRH